MYEARNERFETSRTAIASRSRKAPTPIRLTLAVLVAVLLAPAVRADRGVLPLGSLLEAADSVVIGQVGPVEETDGGEQTAVLQVLDVFRGSSIAATAVRGSASDPMRPRLVEGTRVLAFLTGVDTADGIAEPVAGEQGFVVIGDGAVGRIRELLSVAVGHGARFGLAEMQEQLTIEPACDGRRSCALPPSLVGALLEELTLRTSSAQAARIAEMACDTELYLPAARFWAVERAGRIGVSEARPCLERSVERSGPRVEKLVAIQALGEMGQTASVPLLRSLLPELPPLAPGQSVPGSFDVTPLDPGVGPDDDPEAVPQIAGDEERVAPRRSGRAAARNADDLDEPRGTGAVEGTEPAADPGQSEVALDEERGAADPALAEAAVLALGKIGDPSVVSDLERIARGGGDLALHSTVVTAIGMIGGAEAEERLASIGGTHPNELVRRQAQQTLERVRNAPRR